MKMFYLNDASIRYSGQVTLTPEIISLATRVQELKSRIGLDLLKLCYTLYQIKQHLKDDYVPFCKEVFGFSESQIYKYPRIGEGVSRLPRQDDNSLDVRIIEQFSSEALLALSKADDNVIAEAAQRAGDGEKITASVAQDLLAVRNELIDRERDLARERAEKDELKSQALRKDEEVERLTRALNNTKARLEESETEVIALQQRQREIIANANKQPLVAVTEKAPDTHEAENLLDGLNSEISRAQSRREAVLAEVKKLERDLAEVNGRMATMKQAATSLDALKSDIDAILAKYTDVLLIQIRASIPQSKVVLDEYADKLRDLANHISE